MMTSFNNILDLLPEGATWVIALTLILLLLGWISSIAIAIRHKWMVLLAFFPVTNPIAVVAMLFKQTSTGMIPFACYALALATWLYGSHRAHKVEFERLYGYEKVLKEQGEPLRAAAYQKSPSNPQENVWDHPYLKPLGLAGQPTPEGEKARKTTEQLYENWSLPGKKLRIRYEDPDRDRLSFIQPTRRLHEASIQFLQESETSESEYPTSPAASAKALTPFFHNTEEDMEQLREAVFRSEDVYPHEWERGFDMLLPQLAKLKQFTQITSLASIYQSIQGVQDASYEQARLAFQLAETGDSDLLISRLVQFAQLHIALETIMSAQQAHLWSDEQWVQIRSRLDKFNLPALIPNSLRAERAVGYSYVEPMFTQSWSRAMKQMDHLGAAGKSEIETGLWMTLLDSVASKFSQAFLAKQWRLCMEAYSLMIEDLEQGVQASYSGPWKEIHTTWSDENLLQYGVFAKMLIPALSQAQNKAFLMQLKIELAKTAIDLERYYLKHGHYPDALGALSPAFRDTTPLDPMTRKMLKYEKVEDAGFELYSVGMNGEDDQGRHAVKPKRNENNPPDDLLWVIRVNPPELPSFHVDE